VGSSLQQGILASLKHSISWSPATAPVENALSWLSDLGYGDRYFAAVDWRNSQLARTIIAAFEVACRMTQMKIHSWNISSELIHPSYMKSHTCVFRISHVLRIQMCSFLQTRISRAIGIIIKNIVLHLRICTIFPLIEFQKRVIHYFLSWTSLLH